jgi:hypothetical protein
MNIRPHSGSDKLLSIFLYVQVGDEKKLDQTLFILSAQRYHPIEIFIVVDGYWDPDFDGKLKLILKRWNINFFKLSVIPPCGSSEKFWTVEGLLPYCQGQYLTFLAAGQKIYPYFYSTLIEGLINSPNHICAYSDVVMTHYNQSNQVSMRWAPFLHEGYSAEDHTLFDFIPIHSVVFDRFRVAHLNNCYFEFRSECHHKTLMHLIGDLPPLHLAIIGAEVLSAYAVSADFSHIKKEIADRYQKDSSYYHEAIEDDEENSMFIGRKPFLDKQFSLELERYELLHNPNAFYFRMKLQECYESTSWRVTQPFRNLITILQGLPPNKNTIPTSEVEAFNQLINVRNSKFWRLTRLIRSIEKYLN